MDWIGAKVDWINKIRFFAHPYGKLFRPSFSVFSLFFLCNVFSPFFFLRGSIAAVRAVVGCSDERDLGLFLAS